MIPNIRSWIDPINLGNPEVFMQKIQVSSVQFTPGWLGYIRDEILPSYIGIIIRHYKDPYQPTSIMECQQGFERCSGVFFNKYLYPGSQADYSMVVFGSRSKGGIGSIFHPPKGKDYKWYISGIYCQLGDYMLPTTLYKNLKNLLNY